MLFLLLLKVSDKKDMFVLLMYYYYNDYSWCYMKVVIKNIDDYRTFLNKLWIYKSFLYHNTIFEVDSNIDSVLDIVNALNIKKRKKRIDYVYDKACEYLDLYIKDNNVCDFIDNKCFVQRRPNNTNKDGCCGPIKCKHIKNGVCTTKNISCKLFYCPDARKKAKVLGMKDIDILKLLSFRQRLVIVFNVASTREEILKDLYSYSLIYAILRIFIRDFKNRVLKR